MRKTIFSLIMVLSLFIFLVGPANATTTSFGDDTIYWPGHQNNTQQDYEDVIGIPDIIGGTYTVTGSVLQTITFQYTGDTTAHWDALVPGDLFIDTDANGRWDYVAVNGTGTGSGNWELWKIDTAVGAGTDAYIMTNETGAGYLRGGGAGWVGLQPRIDHPVAIENGQKDGIEGAVHFNGWQNLGDVTDILTAEFEFDGGLDVGSDWIFGWTVNCGNDVIYEHGSSEAPIPAAVWLLGSGLLGLIGVRRRSKM